MVNTVPHIRLDENGRPWVDDTNVKVIEVVLDHLAYGQNAVATQRLRHAARLGFGPRGRREFGPASVAADRPRFFQLNSPTERWLLGLAPVGPKNPRSP